MTDSPAIAVDSLTLVHHAEADIKRYGGGIAARPRGSNWERNMRIGRAWRAGAALSSAALNVNLWQVPTLVQVLDIEKVIHAIAPPVAACTPPSATGPLPGARTGSSTPAAAASGVRPGAAQDRGTQDEPVGLRHGTPLGRCSIRHGG